MILSKINIVYITFPLCRALEKKRHNTTQHSKKVHVFGGEKPTRSINCANEAQKEQKVQTNKKQAVT